MIAAAITDSIKDALADYFTEDIDNGLFAIAEAEGTISVTVSLFLAVISPCVIHWGDGSTSEVDGSDLTEYTHTYVAASSPEISVDDPTGITDMELELGGDFLIDFTNDINKTIFTSLESFVMTDVTEDNWIGSPFTALPNVSLELG